MRLVNDRQLVSLLRQTAFTTPTTGEKMKTFKAICAAAILALSLTIPAYADGNPGDGHGPGRTSFESSDYGLPSAPADSLTSGAVSTGDNGLVTIADIIWALASIY